MNYLKRGFTLLEVILVIFIISLILIISYPKLKGIIENIRFKNEVNELVYDLIGARSRAMGEGYNYRINIYPNEDRYRIIKTYPSLLTIKDKYLSNNIEMVGSSFDDGQFFYSQSGTPSGSGTIILKYKDKFKAYVTVLIATGRVKITYE